MKKLDPNAKVGMYISGVIGCLFIFGWLFVPFLTVGLVTGDGGVFVLFIVGLVLYLIFSLTVPFLWAHLWYENFGYKFESDRVSIEKGIIFKKYVSIPYNRIQNVDIHRGPIARALDLSDLQIQTAGASGVQIIEGRIPGVSKHDAEKQRDEILSKVTGNKSSGL